MRAPKAWANGRNLSVMPTGWPLCRSAKPTWVGSPLASSTVSFFMAASQSSSVFGGLSGSRPAFLKRSVSMYICWKLPCSIGMPYRTPFHLPTLSMYFGRFSSQVFARSAGIRSQKSYWPHQWCVMPMKMSGAPLLPIRPRDTSPLALIRHGNDVDLVAGLLREVPPARLVVLIELRVLLPVRPEDQLLRLGLARRHRQRHRRERLQRDHAPSTHAPPFIGGT